MKNASKSRKFSILLKINAIVVVMTIFITGLSAYIEFENRKKELRQELQMTCEGAAERLSKNLYSQIWDMDDEMVKSSLKSEMFQKSVYAILVEENNAITYGVIRDSAWKPVYESKPVEGDFITVSKDILKNDQKLGVVEVYCADRFMIEELIEKTVRIAVTSLLTILAITIAIFLALRTYLIKPVNQLVNGFTTCAHTVLEASGEMSSTSESLSQSASEQAASIEETSASLEQMAAMSLETTQLTKGAEDLMNDNISKSGQSLKNLVQLTEEMSRIEADSGEMGQIIKTIDEIAFQTNLLALNAAVEAARAGEAGAGFAIVADEVRNLALRASGAAENTQTLLDKTVKRVSHASKSIKEINEDFEGIIESATVMGEKTQAITTASEEQSRGIQQISVSANEIDRVTQQIAAGSEQSAAVAQDLQSRSKELKQYIRTLLEIIGGSAYSASSRQ